LPQNGSGPGDYARAVNIRCQGADNKRKQPHPIRSHTSNTANYDHGSQSGDNVRRSHHALLLLDCCNAVHFLEPLSDKLHSSFVVNKVIFSDPVFPHVFSSSLCARLQTKELDACYAKRDFESTDLIVDCPLLAFEQSVYLRASLALSYIHGCGDYHNSRLNSKETA
jgi:hypothetical protein